MSDERILAYVECDTPESAMTLDEWIEWRRQQDARIIATVMAQIEAMLMKQFCNPVEH